MKLIRLTQFLVLLLMIVATTACRHRGTSDCSGIDPFKAVDAAAVLAGNSCGNGVTASFEYLGNSNSTFSNLDSILCGGELCLGLHDACCLAALNSPIANLIDKERNAVCCEAGCIKCVDQFLVGQALEQRNKSAANAGELLLRLIEANLLQQIIDESLTKMAELEETVRVADENGLATAEAESKLNAERTRVQKQLIIIRNGILELSVKLNLILGIDSCSPKTIRPDFELNPLYDLADVEQLVIEALTNRPELSSMSEFGGCSPDEDCLSLLSQLDPRLGIKTATRLKGCFLLKGLEGKDNGSCCARKNQIQELRNGREELVRQQVIDAAIDMKSSYERLVLDNSDLARLEEEAQLIESSAELDAQAAFIDSIANWARQQQAEATRISTAIEFEIARVRLLEATGRWIQECGLCSAGTGCKCCRH